NTDQGEVVAGQSQPKFGGGRMIRPIYILIDGRATKEFEGHLFPTDSIAVEAAHDYLRDTIPNLDQDRGLIVDCRLGVGSTDLQDVFRPCNSTIPRANDTSFGVGHAPFSETETLVREVSRFIDEDLSRRRPMIGQDVKVMGLRDADQIRLTIGCAMVDRFCPGLAEYMDTKAWMQDEIEALCRKYTSRKVDVDVNTADDIDTGSIFLTVTGTSAEMGDDGSVGRGNRANGLITPNRPMSMEATSGKNPINHIGKIYNIISTQMANACVGEVEGIEECYVRLLSQIGTPIDHPLVASVQVLPKAGVDFGKAQKALEEIVDAQLANITCVTEKVIRGELATF
ncbi:MAG TPA: methionine adenosyltransferase, partial [Methanoregulaceae archaeon]|nr:methionine adenosyltransferase [Methanoregulaceae archaeon]